MQGEGKYIGKRQIFIRFAGCNIDCIYCDTLESKSFDYGRQYSYEELNDTIQSLMTDDFHSLEITGGEPLLQAEYIRGFLSKYPYPAMLETNATLPENLSLLKDVVDVVSMDIKLPEHFNSQTKWQEVYLKELESIRVMQNEGMDYYLKIVVSDTTPLDIIGKIMDDLNEIQPDDTLLVIQPVSPMTKWTDKTHLFEISEIVGRHYPVSIIPQIHKYMDID
ncbi:MAG: 7-carboxy-7-deazaguanine synthase QueE [Methanosphaera sp.]|nr:7-carboxy-7-deazaguanine synthase QueE [Methanosphaera sp.]